ncbi:MAG TPA: acyl-CoA thioesterase II [Acidimicrobiia bacterium]|nr:acyl-CoA thioesterase II [Acidimicrobiia bacterium]
MGTALDDLVALLDLERLEVNLFRGVSPDEERQRVFGGQVAGQALVAAGRTVADVAGNEDRPVHSLHAYFLRPGDPRVPIVYEVDRIRDGRSFTTRRVVAIQHGKAIFNLQASFHKDESGLDYQADMVEAPDPESLPTFRERVEHYRDELGEWIDRPRPIDLRHADTPIWLTREFVPREEQLVWIRADGRLPDDPLLHVCVVTYASDFTLLDNTLLPHGRADDDIMMASLDHAMWFHRPFRADEWLLYSQRPISDSGGRGLAGGLIFTRDGKLAVTVIQEGLIRPVHP